MNTYYSTCCDAVPYGNTHHIDGEPHGVCSRCKEHTVFYNDGYDEENDWDDELEYMREHL